MKVTIPEKIKTFLTQLEENGHEAYIVGGAVRDMLLGINPYDWDIATSAAPGQIKETFKYVAKVKQINASFPVVEVDGIEVATYRKDVYRNGVTISTVQTSKIETDLARRDLTINAMALDRHYNLVDPFRGHRDLEDKLIRFVGDAKERIIEDPVRIVRAARFNALLDGKMERFNFDLNLDSVMESIAPERLRVEVLKAMKYKHASKFFKTLHAMRILGYIFPSLDACWEADHGQYHDEDIFSHMMIAGDYAFEKLPRHCKNKPMFRLTCYLHDVGKSEPNMKDGAIHFYDHEYKGAEMLKAELKALKFTTAEIKYATNLVLVHMRGGVKMAPKTTRIQPR